MTNFLFHVHMLLEELGTKISPPIFWGEGTSPSASFFPYLKIKYFKRFRTLWVGVMGSKSRKERRKEARQAKQQQRQRSWMLHQAGRQQKPASPLQHHANSPRFTHSHETRLKIVNAPKQTEKSATQKKHKRHRTTFEGFIDMERQNKPVGSERDLALERRLAKKLKVKQGMLKGPLDGLSELLEGTAPFLSDVELQDTEHEGPKRNKSARKMKNLQEAMKDPLFILSTGEYKDETKSSMDDAMENEAGEDYEAQEEQEQDSNESMETTEHAKSSPESNNAENALTKYIAPHLRDSLQIGSNDIQLQRRVRGLLNRLSEANVESIALDISSFFQIHGRRIITSMLTAEILGALCGGPRGNDQYAAIFAAFIAGVASFIGMDFGAKFVASFAECFEDRYNDGDGLATRNLVLLYSNFYNFKLVASDMVYDFLHLLCKRFKELDVSTILTILQTCGMALRAEDPAAMKEFVLAVQQRMQKLKAVVSNENTESMIFGGKRMQYMLEIIIEIKNNKRRLKEESASHIRLKKWLQKLGVADAQLRGITWEKLLDPDKKGQWWLSGDIVGSTEDNQIEITNFMDKEAAEAEKVLQLAASQRMNTDVRRAVFCIIMSGEDYMDAFEKILRLDLHGKKDRDVIRVIVECCLQEKMFNRYYSLLAAKMCQHNKNHKFTLQYCIWDHFKQLSSMESRRVVNLARLVADLLGTHVLSLSVLKAVDLSDSSFMTPKVLLHFRICLEALLTDFSDETIWNVFSRIASSSELQNLRDGLSLFLHQNFQNIITANTPNELEEKPVLTRRCQLARKALKNMAGVIL